MRNLAAREDRHFDLVAANNVTLSRYSARYEIVGLIGIVKQGIVEKSIDRLTFISDNERERYAIVKKKDFERTFPLKSMGDGINRILTIILALLNVENGYLFIDEFENGLHYTVQEDL